MKPLDAAIVGFGRVAEFAHLPALLGDRRIRVSAVVDPDGSRRQRARSLLGGSVGVYPGIDDLLARQRPDFAVIATPPATRREVVEALLQAGVHALVEKPLALRCADLTSMTACAAGAGVVLMTVHNWHHAPLFRQARRLVAENAIGRLERIVFRTDRTQPAGGPDSWRLRADRAGGGILIDHGWHSLYLARSLAGAQPATVAAQAERRRWVGADVEDTATCTVEFDNTVRLQLELTWAAERRRTRVLVRGERGEITIGDGEVAVRDRGGAVRAVLRPADAPDDSYHAAWFPPVLAEFLAALEEPDRAIENQREAAACCATIEAAYESARAGGRLVEVDGRACLPAVEYTVLPGRRSGRGSAP